MGPPTRVPGAAANPPAGYLDAASTEPLHPAARAALLAVIDDGWADAARLYGAARRARLLLDGARERVGVALGCRPDEVAFTASGTQAVQLAVAGLALGRRRVGRHLVIGAVEHSSVLHAAELLASAGGNTSMVPVDRFGAVDPDEFAASVRPDTALACLQSGNHEVGTRQPVEPVARACSQQGVPLVVDAAASVGHGPLPQGWSVLAASAHKWGGPAGVGVLCVRTGVRWRSPGPGHERGGMAAPGFENVPGIVSAAVALEAVVAQSPAEDERLRALTGRIRAAVAATVPHCEVVGHPDERLPHIVTFSCLYTSGEALLGELDRAGFAVSSGSSCTASTLEPSHVLVAMGALSQGNIRVSLPRGVAEADVDRFVKVLPGAVRRVRDELGGAAR
jgi:cysteine desulfurase